jgi:hypothetical protein
MPGILNWDLGDSSNNVNSNSPIHTYSSAGTKNIVVKQGTTVSAGNVTLINMSSDDLIGTIDISSFTSLTNFDVNTNKKLTKIISPVSSAAITAWIAYDCSLNGTLDVSGLSGLGGSFYVNGNSNLTKILNPTSSAQINEYYGWYCDLTGTLDVSGLTGLVDFEVNNNPHLTQILNSVSSQEVVGYIAYNCDLTGTLDVSGLTGLGGVFQVHNNPNLTHILNPTSSTRFYSYYAYDCSLNGTLDVSGLTGLGGDFMVYSNSNLTRILNPDSSQIFSSYSAANCNLTETLDVSGLIGLGGYFGVYNNHNLTQILNPNSSQAFNAYYANNCNLTGTLNISGLTGLGGYFEVSYNPSLNYIINPNSSQILDYSAYNCNLTGILDVSGLTGLGGYLSINDNPKLTGLTLPATLNRQFSYFSAMNCSLNITSIDAALAKLHTLYDASAPIANLICSFDGTGNAWPTDGLDNRNLCKIQNIFDGSTIYNASITINPEPMDSSIDALNFDGSTYVIFNNTANVSTWGSPISFSMHLDVSRYGTNYFPKRLIYACSSTNECENNFSIMLDGSIFSIEFGSTDVSSNGFLNIYDDNLYGQNLFVEIFHSPGPTTRRLDAVKINGVIQTFTWDVGGHGHVTTGKYPYFILGAITNNGTTYTNILNKATLWNLRFTRTGKWKGYPTGNTNAGWTDRIGTNDGSIISSTSGGPTTRHLTTIF